MNRTSGTTRIVCKITITGPRRYILYSFGIFNTYKSVIAFGLLELFCIFCKNLIVGQCKYTSRLMNTVVWFLCSLADHVRLNKEGNQTTPASSYEMDTYLLRGITNVCCNSVRGAKDYFSSKSFWKLLIVFENYP